VICTTSIRWRLRERDDLAAGNERKAMTSEPFDSSYWGAAGIATLLGGRIPYESRYLMALIEAPLENLLTQSARGADQREFHAQCPGDTYRSRPPPNDRYGLRYDFCHSSIVSREQSS
jgi:hypothetical protein